MEKTMHTEDPLRFVDSRLRQNHSPLERPLRLRPATRVLRRFAVELPRGGTHVFDRVDGSVMVRCASGSLWITHDGDPKDVVLSAQESYRCEREEAMHLHALQACVLEIEFEDDVLVTQ